jgi:hypothetical protein
VKRRDYFKDPPVDLIDDTLKPFGAFSASVIPKPLDHSEIVFSNLM